MFFCKKCYFLIISLSLLFVATDEPKKQSTVFSHNFTYLQGAWRGEKAEEAKTPATLVVYITTLLLDLRVSDFGLNQGSS